MANRLNITLSNKTIVLILIIMTFVTSNLNWGKDHWKGIVEADAKGYYSYLPAVFIYKDLNFGFFKEIEQEKYYDTNLYYDYRAGFKDKVINKYYAGTALLQMPFFLVAHWLNTNYDADGYSKPYMVSITVAALFYLWIGLIFLNKLLQTYSISEQHRSIVLLITVFGTNLFYYTVGEPGLSHIYSLALVAAFMYHLRFLLLSPTNSRVVLTGFLLGLICLVRPINGLIIFAIPFLSGDYSQFKLFIKNLFTYKSALVIAVIVFFATLSIQLLVYKLATGHFIVYSYGEEGFNFRSPHILDILFSYKKGLFLYTPIFFIASTVGLLAVLKRSKFEVTTWMFFFLLITYVFSSWWMWYYGGSFSSRVYVEFIPFFMIPLALSLHYLKKGIWQKSYLILLTFLVVICQIQTFQYRYYYIHWSDMTKEKYWDVFLRIDLLF
jgi:hypothetical protein